MLRFLARPRLRPHRAARGLLQLPRASCSTRRSASCSATSRTPATAGTLALDALAAGPRRASSSSACTTWARSPGRMHAVLASDPEDPDFAPEEPSEEHVALITRDDRRADRAQLRRRCPSSTALAPIAGRARGAARPPAAALAPRRRRAADPHPRRLPPRPDRVRRRRLDGARLRGRAGAADARAPAQALAAARRRRHAALVRLRGARRRAAARRRRRRPTAGRREARERFLDGLHGRRSTASCCRRAAQAIDKLLTLFELEKALYELRYELDNRPDWVPIPVAAIARLLEQPPAVSAAGAP